MRERGELAQLLLLRSVQRTGECLQRLQLGCVCRGESVLRLRQLRIAQAIERGQQIERAVVPACS